MKALFIGGTGTLSASTVETALRQGFTVSVLNRGQTDKWPLPESVERITGDIRQDPDAVAATLGDRSFDVVLDFVAFTPEDVEQDIRLFAGRCGQFIFISSASAYDVRAASLPVTESTRLHNPYWAYSRQKAVAEHRLRQELEATGFPVTIVRPSHTYDARMIPIWPKWSGIARMRAGEPVPIHGDGTSLWTLTHTRDFAVGLAGLMGHSGAVGEAVHITSDEWLSWQQIYRLMADAAGVAGPIQLAPVPSARVEAALPKLGGGLLGDKAVSRIFDNSKIRKLVPAFHQTIPFARGAHEIIDWYDADPGRQAGDDSFDRLLDNLVADAGDALIEV
ncbi:MAG: NAD-dependent epimerase/dehydratase family protein [Opitutales bacterium]